MEVRLDNPSNYAYEDIKFTNNNGLRPTVEVLEAIYVDPLFPLKSPALTVSLRDSGKSRADLWSLAAVTAVELGVETNNRKCEYPDSVKGCHHLQVSYRRCCLIKLKYMHDLLSGKIAYPQF